VRFALVEKSTRRQERTAEAVLELVLATGERLRMGAGVDISRPCAPCWTCCGDDPPASQRAGVPLPHAVRYAQG
jgi:hypothetical protein